MTRLSVPLGLVHGARVAEIAETFSAEATTTAAVQSNSTVSDNDLLSCLQNRDALHEEVLNSIAQPLPQPEPAPVEQVLVVVPKKPDPRESVLNQ